MSIKTIILDSYNIKEFLLEDAIVNKIVKISEAVSNCLLDGKKILIAGNGGSATDAQHFAGEIVGRFKLERKAYPAIALTTDGAILTCLANDYYFDLVFSRQIEALGEMGDVFFGISTSGNSNNVIEATKQAKNMGLKTIGLLGKDGGKLRDMFDLALIIPSQDTPRIQEAHILVIHIICEIIEKGFKK